MAYYVIGHDGGRYGPADIVLLNQWAREGRLAPASVLEEEGTGIRLVAGQISGLIFPPGTPGVPGAPIPGRAPGPYDQPYQGYYRDRQQPTSDGQTELVFAWILGSIGLFCCPIVLSTVGIFLASSAKNKGNPGGQAAMIYCIVTLVAGMLLGVVSFAMRSPHGRYPF